MSRAMLSKLSIFIRWAKWLDWMRGVEGKGSIRRIRRKGDVEEKKTSEIEEVK